MLVHFLQTFFTYFVVLRYTKILYFFYIILFFIGFCSIILIL